MIREIVLANPVFIPNNDERQVALFRFDDNCGVWSGYALNPKYRHYRPASPNNERYILANEEVSRFIVAERGLDQEVITESDYYEIVMSLQHDEAISIESDTVDGLRAYGEFLLQGKEINDEDLLSFIAAAMNNDKLTTHIPKVSARIERRPTFDDRGDAYVASFVVVEIRRVKLYEEGEVAVKAWFTSLMHYLLHETDGRMPVRIEFWNEARQIHQVALYRTSKRESSTQ
jgi:hypothetical protein